MRLPPVSLTLLTSHPRKNKGTEWSPPFLEDESFIISEKQQKRLVQELAFIAFHGGNAANFSNILYFHTSKIHLPSWPWHSVPHQWAWMPRPPSSREHQFCRPTWPALGSASGQTALLNGGTRPLGLPLAVIG